MVNAKESAIMTTIVAYTKFVMKIMFASISIAINTLDVFKVKSARKLVTFRFAYHIRHVQTRIKNVHGVFLIHIVVDVEKCAFWVTLRGLVKQRKVELIYQHLLQCFLSVGLKQLYAFAHLGCTSNVGASW